MKIKPIGERVLIKPIRAGEKTTGGIYIPEEAKAKYKDGVLEVTLPKTEAKKKNKIEIE